VLAPASASFKAGVAVGLANITVLDADSPQVTLTIQASRGGLTLGDLPAGVSVVSQTANQMALRGAPDLLNKAVNAVKYTAPTLGTPSLTFTVNDGDNTVVSKSLSVAIIDNAPPSPGGDLTLSGVVEDAQQSLTISPTLLIDSDSPNGTLPTKIRILSVEGGTLTLDNGSAIVIGDTSTPLALNGSGGLQVKFTPDANRNVDAVIRYVVVDPVLDTLNSAPSFITLPIQAVNDKPVLSIAQGTVIFTENSAPLSVLPLVGITDVDSKALSQAVVQIAAPQIGDVLSFTTLNGIAITGAFNAATGTMTLTGLATGTPATYPTLDQFRQALQSVRYSNSPGRFEHGDTADRGDAVRRGQFNVRLERTDEPGGQHHAECGGRQ